MLYTQNPEAGGELAVSLMEQILTGDHSSDDFMVEFAIANYKDLIMNNWRKYDTAKEAKQEAIEAGLREIAEMVRAGMKQVDIARKLNLSAPVVSKKVAKIKKEFPHLLEIGNSARSCQEEKVAKLPIDENLASFSASRQDLLSCQVAKVSGN